MEQSDQPPRRIHGALEAGSLPKSTPCIKSRRQVWLTVHRYLGLFAGLVFAITGLTGSLIAFGGAIDAWLNPELMIVEVPDRAARRPLDEIVAAALAVMPADGSPMNIQLPRDADRALSIAYGKASTAVPDDMDHFEIFVDPYSARVIGQREQSIAGEPFSGPLMELLVSVHYTLLLGMTGTVLVGVIAVLLMISVISGIVVWWPRSSKWVQALTIKRSASAERLNYDLHKTFGAYSALVFLVILFSGVYMNLPDYVTPLVELFSPAPGWPEDVRSTPLEGRATLTPGQALAVSESVFDDGELMGIEFPEGPDGAYVIRRRAPDEVTHAYPHRQIWVDPYDGSILAVNDPHQYTAGQKFLEWQFPLHSGEAFGLPGRIFVLILGFVPLLLYVTGLIRWLQKRRAAGRKERVASDGRGFGR